MAGSDGDMSVISMDDEISDHVYPLIDSLDMASTAARHTK
jgi:hypothetical protein